MDQVNYPVLITNFKAFQSATGLEALKLAKIHEEVALKYGVNMAVCPQVMDIWMIASQVNIPVLAHHFDAVTHGQFTGHIVPEALKMAGADGSLLNHAEKRVPFNYLADSLNRAREIGFFTCVCAGTLEEAKNIAALHPDCVAIEPPELIGGDVSVSTASPDIIKRAVAEVKNVPILVGAGVKTPEDVRIALSLGARGILVASGITKAKDPRAVLESFAKVMKEFT